MKRLLPALLLIPVCLLLIAPSAGAKAPPPAADLTQQCTFSASAATGKLDQLHDDKRSTFWSAPDTALQYVQVSLPSKVKVAGVYVMWNAPPSSWELQTSADGKQWVRLFQDDENHFLNQYVPLKSGSRHIRILQKVAGWKLSIAELKVFGEGTLPTDVQLWKPTVEKADLMVIPAHPDDEQLYFGGILPTYAGQQRKHTVVLYMTSSPVIRKVEGLAGLWKVGVSEYPVFLGLINKYSTAMDDAAKIWDGTDNTVALLVEMLRKYKPEVVVTHDLGGEYGHGAHKLTAWAVEQAVRKCGDPRQFPLSAQKYGAWQVKKCYLHLYDKDSIRLNWRVPLSRFGGKTALEMAQEGYACHVSQHFHDRTMDDFGPYDNSLYGLAYTSVGPDKLKNDFFENIGVEAPKPTVTASATATATATPARTMPTPSASAVKEQPAQGKPIKPPIADDAALPLSLLLLAAVYVAYIAYRKYSRKK